MNNRADLSARISLPVEQPYDWPALLQFFAGRATPGVESVNGGRYRRTICLDGSHRILDVSFNDQRKELVVSLIPGSRAEVKTLLPALRRMFDTAAPIGAISKVLKRDASLGPLLRNMPGFRVPGAWDGFELTVRAILGQQVSVKAATTLAGRVAERYGEKLRIPQITADDKLNRLFPLPSKLKRAKMNNMGIVGARIASIRSVAAEVERGTLQFGNALEPQAFRQALVSIRGIGDWTAEYVAMRAEKDADAFPASDLGLMKAIAWPDRVTPAELADRAEGWRPWRAYAALLLWGSLPATGG